MGTGGMGNAAELASAARAFAGTIASGSKTVRLPEEKVRAGPFTLPHPSADSIPSMDRAAVGSWGLQGRLWRGHRRRLD